MGRKRRARQQAALLPDGYYWFKDFLNLPGGGYGREWKLAQIAGGKFRQVGVAAEWQQDCDYLRDALWVKLVPPPPEAGDTTAIRTASELRRDARVGRDRRDDDYRARQRALILAEGVVAAFTELNDSTAAYYARRPEQRAELVAEIARLIGRVRE